MHERGDQLLPPCKEQVLLVVSRLRGHGVHERLGVQDALARFDKERVGRGKHRGDDGRMRGHNGLVAQRIEAVDQPLLLRRLDVQFGFLDGQHKGLARFRARLAELHEQQKALQRDKARALPLRGKGWPGALREVRHDAFQNGIAIGRGQAQLKSGCAGHERAQLVIGSADDLGQSRLIFEPRPFRRGPEARSLGAHGLRGHVPARRHHAAEQLRRKGNPAIPCARGRDQKEAQLLKRLGVDGAQVRVLRERIAQRGFVVHEEADGFGFQLVQIEPRGKADLHGQVRMLRIRRGAERLGVGIEPFLNAAFGTEP